MTAWIKRHALTVTLFFVVIGSARVTSWLWLPYRVMEIKSLVVDRAEIYPDDVLLMRMDYCKDKNFAGKTAEVRFSFVDTLTYQVPIVAPEWISAGCHVATESLWTPKIAPGSYVIEMARTYAVNPIRTVTVIARSNRFTILQPRELVDLDVALSKLLAANHELIAANELQQRRNAQLLSALNLLLKPKK